MTSLLANHVFNELEIPIYWFKPCFWGKEKEYLIEAFNSTWISDGEFIRKFEKKLAEAFSTEHFICVSNGTVALMLAMMCENIGPGDEVILPGYGFAAPANVVCALGAKPIFVDVLEDTWCLDPNAIEKAITRSTKAIVAIHTYGNLCDMDKINDIARLHSLVVIEDVAEAAFSTYRNCYAGTLGNYGCFSFQATKTITTGEGGGLIVNSLSKKKLAELIRSHGMEASRRYWHQVVGLNFRLTNLQAAIGVGQMECIDLILAAKQWVYDSYAKLLNNIQGLTLQKISSHVNPVMWTIACTVPDHLIEGRNRLINYLDERHIETRPGFGDVCQMPAFIEFATSLPVSQSLSQRIISLPSFPTISINSIEYICESIGQFLTINGI